MSRIRPLYNLGHLILGFWPHFGGGLMELQGVTNMPNNVPELVWDVRQPVLAMGMEEIVEDGDLVGLWEETGGFVSYDRSVYLSF